VCISIKLEHTRAAELLRAQHDRQQSERELRGQSEQLEQRWRADADKSEVRR
jgi:hypothetical protein